MSTRFKHSAALVEALSTISNVEDIPNKDGILFVVDSDPDLLASDQIQRGAEIGRYAASFGMDVYYGAYQSPKVEGLYGFVYVVSCSDERAAQRIIEESQKARGYELKKPADPILAAIQAVLWPEGDPEGQQWDPDTIDQIAQIFQSHGLAPIAIKTK